MGEAVLPGNQSVAPYQIYVFSFCPEITVVQVMKEWEVISNSVGTTSDVTKIV